MADFPRAEIGLLVGRALGGLNAKHAELLTRIEASELAFERELVGQYIRQPRGEGVAQVRAQARARIGALGVEQPSGVALRQEVHEQGFARPPVGTGLQDRRAG